MMRNCRRRRGSYSDIRRSRWCSSSSPWSLVALAAWIVLTDRKVARSTDDPTVD